MIILEAMAWLCYIKREVHYNDVELLLAQSFGESFVHFVVQVNNFSVMLGRSHRFLVIYLYYEGVHASCSMKTQLSTKGV